MGKINGPFHRWRRIVRTLCLCAGVGSFGLTAGLPAQNPDTPGVVKVAAKRPSALATGLPADQVADGDRVLAFVKGPSRRTLYKEGSYLKIMTADRRKVQGYINRITDTAVMINGLNYRYERIAAYYVPLRACTIAGTALCVAGGGYLLLDGVNGAINRRQPAFHVEALSVGIPLAAAGGVTLAFKEIKRRTAHWRIKVMKW